MNKHLSLTLMSIVALTVVSCAPKNVALQDARSSFKSASSDPSVVKNAPVALHDAEVALQQANKAEQDDAKKEDVTHFANLASKRVEIARLEAQKKSEDTKFQTIVNDQAGMVVAAREKETKGLREKSDALKSTNADLQSAALQNQADADALKAKNDALAKELADLKMKPTPRGMELTLRDTMFEFGKADLTTGARRDLEKISQRLKSAPTRQITVEGHTDSIGSDEFNEALSQRRADVVRDVLIRDTEASRVTARGLGKQYPIATNSTESGRQQNRRVTIILSTENTGTTQTGSTQTGTQTGTTQQ
jgi:outer membrane protein OmpA-like peptidoglycan-associated protein